jgi:uncharacterized protein YjbI with pentapeptide repeats
MESTYLRGSNFTHAALDGALLRHAVLIETNFLNASMKIANFFNAGLHAASMRSSNLSGADLSEAALNDAFFANCNLVGCNFAGATLARTVFANCDLSGSVGLDSCKHAGPSHIDNGTLSKSANLTPDFLRRCGFQDWEIETAELYRKGLAASQIIDIGYKVTNAHLANPIQYFSCFISYSHADVEFAVELQAALQERGIRCWLDEKQLLPGDDIFEQVDYGIRLWDKLLLCCSEAALTSWWVDNEIISALEKEQRLMKERQQKIMVLTPLNLDGYMFRE